MATIAPTAKTQTFLQRKSVVRRKSTYPEERRTTRIKRTLMCLTCTVVCIVIVVVILLLFVVKFKLSTESLACESAVCHEETCDDLAAALGDPNEKVGPLYSLALVASDVLRYHYRLSGHGGDERPNEEALHGVCYEVTRRAFRWAWSEILSAFVGLNNDAGEFMTAYVRFMTAKLQDRYHNFIVLRKDDFIYNRVAVYAPTVVNCTRTATNYSKAVLKYLEAFRVAYQAKSSSDSRAASGDAEYVAATDTVFFKLACQALCTTPGAPVDPNGLHGLPAHAACLYAAGTMHQFHSAFACTEANDMWHLLKCDFM
ncbi:hypothetical protein MTO96_002436 [Rhipicephalus appendiculatus]